MYAVSGTQADELKNNRLYVVKISDIEQVRLSCIVAGCTSHLVSCVTAQIADDEDDDGLSDDDEDATLHYKWLPDQPCDGPAIPLRYPHILSHPDS